jgi:purine-binding chemotaxis protein CheW
MNEYLTFSLAGDHYAFSIKDVDSVVEVSAFTRLPKTAAYMRGIMNLRGSMIPVIDLRLKFGLPVPAGRAAESVIVLSFEEDGETRLVGAIADEVHEVLTLDDADIEKAPTIAAANVAETTFVSGIAQKGDGFIVILDAGAAYADRVEGETEALPAAAEA